MEARLASHIDTRARVAGKAETRPTAETGSLSVRHLEERLTADPARVVIRPFHLAPGASSPRTRRIVNDVLALSSDACETELRLVNHDFANRHWQTREVYLSRFAHVAAELGLDPAAMSEPQRELIGACFCHEYSYAAAALMNPSVVPHVDQSGLGPGDVRFVMSVRAVGEGHISSIAFREGILFADGTMLLAPEAPFAMAVNGIGDNELEADGGVCVSRHDSASLSGTVIFPLTAQQRNGLEDLRLVRFTEDDGTSHYYGTYTAFSGSAIASELLETSDFRRFCLRPMQGSAIASKGMALFPRRIGGDYCMLGRMDNESLFFMRSDDLFRWDISGEAIFGPRFAWERIQIGNCGPPMEVDEGWLVLTHGVGAMRQYSIGAALLDKDDPRKVLARLPHPLLSPSDEFREGYVPNVVYTCGGLVNRGLLFMPYGVADSSVSFCTIPVRDLLAEMV
jgi:predicted GH43/DUF377 family glycosyl hydrolase